MRRLLAHAVLGLSVLGLLPALVSASAEAPPQLDRDAATQLLVLVNAERVARGLTPLTDDPALRGWAERHSLHMATTGVLAHNDALFTRAAHQSLGIKIFAENVAWDDPQFGVVGAHRQFIGSPHHHDNMLGPAYRLAGFAVAKDSRGRVWVTEDFGTPRVAMAPPKPAVRPRPPAPPKPVPARPVAKPAAPKPVAAKPAAPAVPVPEPVVPRAVAPVAVQPVRAAPDPPVARAVAAVPSVTRSSSLDRQRPASIVAGSLLVLVTAGLVVAWGDRRRQRTLFS